MQVNCPNCGERVAAGNINIQNMTAVCAACDSVFPFALPEPKTKRRKVKQPTRLMLRDADTLRMEFRTNFRLDQNEALLSSVFIGISMLFVALMLFAIAPMPLILPLAFLTIAAASFYGMALIAFNKTHIEMDEDSIRVTRKPLPNPLNQGVEVPLAGVTAIRHEETAASKKNAYDTPRYRVWAETADGIHRTIVNDVTEDYALFIAQSLEERLYTDSEPDGFRLEARGERLDDDEDMREGVQASRNNGRR